MEEAIAEARLRVGGAGEPGTEEARRALGAVEAAEALTSRRVRLDYSDGSSAAFGLFREAAWWALRAHLLHEGSDGPFPEEPTALWDKAMAGRSGACVAAVDSEIVARARAAFGSRGWEIAQATEDIRLNELRALREVVSRLVHPLEAGMARLSSLRIMRVLRIGTVVAVAAGTVYAGGATWKSYRRGPNFALHTQASASSNFAGYDTAAGVVDGNTSDLGMHTAQQERPWLQIDLGQMRPIRQVVVFNREDCCRDRAVPLTLEVSADGKDFREIARRDFEFSKWRATVGPVEARYLRFTSLKKTWLHFN